MNGPTNEEIEPSRAGAEVQQSAAPQASAVPLRATDSWRHGAIPLALYIHIPWCVRKCPYCDFNSHERKETLPEDAYVAALLSDIELALPQIWGRRIHSVFFGGGTPSLFSADAIDRILSGARTLLPFEPYAEVTLEANPGTYEVERFRDYHAAGINRLSLGVQSFNDAALRALGRIHTAEDARKALESAADLFERVNLDLMYGLPQQTLEQAINDIDIALRSDVGHVSVYNLTIEPNTPFAAHPPELPDNDSCDAMQRAIETRLAAQNYTRYEISAYARPQQNCRHNLNYWRFGDYLGIGAGAHSKLSLPDSIQRHALSRHPRDYLNRTPSERVEAQRTLNAGDRIFEFMLNALRLIEGASFELFERTTGLPRLKILPLLDQAEARGLLARDHQSFRATELGLRHHNTLLELFLPS